MKLALITAYPPSDVILREYAYHLIKNFKQHQKITELILLTDTIPADKKIDFSVSGCQITVDACWEFNGYRNTSFINKALNRAKPDAVLFNVSLDKIGTKKISVGLSLLLPLICKIKQLPTMVLFNDVLAYKTAKKQRFITKKIQTYIHNKFTKLILKADVVAVATKKEYTYLQETYNANNIKLIPKGNFEIPVKPNGVLPKGALKIMTFGAFGANKNVENLIEAVVQLRAITGLDLEIVIARDNSMNSSDYLELVAKKYKRVKQLIVIEHITENKKAEWFKKSAVVVLPNTTIAEDTRALRQAGSYGKAIVAPKYTDMVAVFKNQGYKGEFFEPNNVDSLVTAIEEIVMNEVYRKYLEETNYKASTAYPIEKVVGMYINEFERIIEHKNIARIYNDASMA